MAVRGEAIHVCLSTSSVYKIVLLLLESHLVVEVHNPSQTSQSPLPSICTVAVKLTVPGTRETHLPGVAKRTCFLTHSLSLALSIPLFLSPSLSLSQSKTDSNH